MIFKYVKINCAILLSAALMHSANAGEYKSQSGQDIVINEIFFKNKKGGVFIDIGAHDGVGYSNTWFFEKVLDWTGICIEPNPTIFKKLKENRNCLCINGCISDKDGSVLFREIRGSNYLTMLSGIESKYDPRHLERIATEMPRENGSYKLIEVPSYLLNNILEKNSIYYVDFLSLDIEGGELDVLKTIDFDRFHIHTIAVENNYHTKDIRLFLESHGFRYITTIDDLDEIYLNITLSKGTKLPKKNGGYEVVT